MCIALAPVKVLQIHVKMYFLMSNFLANNRAPQIELESIKFSK